jgi:hypothetical protein
MLKFYQDPNLRKLHAATHVLVAAVAVNSCSARKSNLNTYAMHGHSITSAKKLSLIVSCPSLHLEMTDTFKNMKWYIATSNSG